MANPNTHNQNEKASTFNPFSWGILFFAFWSILQTIEQLTALQKGISWVLIVFSVILLFSVYISPLRRLLISRKAGSIILPVIFLVTIMTYTLSWVTSLPSMQGGYMAVALVIGFLWLVTLLVLLVRTARTIIGVLASIVLFIPGVIYLTRLLFYEGSYLIVLAVILLYVAMKKPAWIYNHFPVS